MQVARGRTRAEAWLDAVSKINPSVDDGRVHNLVIQVDEPSAATPQSRKVETVVDQALRRNDRQPTITVAETIFPMTEYKRGGMKAVYAYPKTIFPLIKSERANRQGTYALRLVERKCSDGGPMNPLETMMNKLRFWLDHKDTRRAAYELDMCLEPAELKLYEAVIDHNNHRGGQCLSHLSFKLGPNHELYLTAMYRLQYLVLKGLGNFRGLANLQAVVARELGIPVGPLVIHATLAQLDVGAVHGVGAFREILNECKGIFADGVTS